MEFNSEFVAPPWFANPHMQSCFGTLAAADPKVELRWQELALPDGDFIDLAWIGPDVGSLVILLHGLEGSVHSPYIQVLLRPLLAHGWRAVVMHYRSCSGRLNRLPWCYHGADTRDLTYLLQWLQQTCPESKRAVVAFSVGANIFLRYLIETAASSIQAGVGVSVPFELGATADYLSPMYQQHLLATMKEKILRKIAQGTKMPIRRSQVENIKTIREFDNVITAPLFGYPDAESYYQVGSCRSGLAHIQLPILLLHAYDDPFVPARVIPMASELGPNTCMELSATGGHLGFVKGTPWAPDYWLAERIPRYLQQYI